MNSVISKLLLNLLGIVERQEDLWVMVMCVFRTSYESTLFKRVRERGVSRHLSLSFLANFSTYTGTGKLVGFLYCFILPLANCSLLHKKDKYIS